MQEPKTPNARASQRDASSAPASSLKPLLASEALREEVAPVEPARRGARLWCVASGAFFGLLLLVPLPTAHAAGGAGAHAVLAIVAVLAGVLPLPYVLRALAMVAVSFSGGVLALWAAGPLGLLSTTVGQWGMLPLLAAVVLGGALLFRARYRAYARAAPIMAAALALALPFAGYCVQALAEGSAAIQVTSGVALAVIAISVIGFSGSAAVVAGRYLAAALILSASAQIASQLLEPFGWPPRAGVALGQALATVAAFATGSALGAVGVYQLLAWRHWRAARVDVRKPPEPRPRAPSLGDSWSTRS